MKHLLGLIFTVALLSAQGEQAVSFLLISPDAHSGGIGESGVSVPETPAMAMHYNVAGLAYQYKYGDTFGNKSEVPLTFSYAEWLPQFNLNDLWYFHGAGLLHLDEIGTFGYAVRYLNLGSVTVTGDQPGDVLGELDASEMEANIGYSTEISNDLFIGVSTKFIYSKITDDWVRVGAEQTAPATTFAVDLGAYYLAGDVLSWVKDVRLGASWVNIGPSITYTDNAQSDPLPTMLRLGASVKFIDDEFSQLRFNTEYGMLTLEQTLSGADFGEILERVKQSYGVEYIYDNTFAVRGGYFHETKRFGDRQFLTAGIGFNAQAFVVDGAYIISTGDSDHPLNDTMRFTFRFMLDQF